jgi:hypothetical protein
MSCAHSTSSYARQRSRITRIVAGCETFVTDSYGLSARIIAACVVSSTANVRGGARLARQAKACRLKEPLAVRQRMPPGGRSLF